MATTISGGRGQCSTPRLADPLLHPQRIKGCRSIARKASTTDWAAVLAPDHAPDPSFAHERSVLAEMALLMAAQQVATNRGNSIAQQLAIWRPFQ